MTDIRTRISAVLISVPLVALALSSFPMLTYVQVTERTAHRGFLFEQIVNEAGYARIAISVLGLLILWRPFRRRELWAWLTLTLLLLVYFLPVRVIPYLVPWPEWNVWREAWRNIRSSRLAQGRLLDPLLVGLMVIGLLLPFPEFLKKRAS